MGRSGPETRRTRPLPPATLKQLLDREGGLAIQRLSSSMQGLGDEVCAAADLRSRIRRHPFLAAGLGAALGFAAVPLAPHVVRWLAAAATSLPRLAARMPGGVAGIVPAWVRRARARR